MNINWQNLTTAIRRGSAAYDSSVYGSPVDTGAIDFYDNPMSDFNQSSAQKFEARPNDFVIGSSKWGGSDLVT